MSGLEYFFISIAALLVIINPLTTAFVFQSLIPYSTNQIKYHIAKRASIIALTILLVFALFGTYIFTLFGITLPAFKIAGGLILFSIAIKMLKSNQGEHDEKHHTGNEMDSEDISVVPLAIPFISGPGTIATTMLLIAQAQSTINTVMVLIAIVIGVLVAYLAMIHSHFITDRVGQTAKKIITKLFGLILAIISVQFVINGAFDLIPDIMILVNN